MAIQFHLRTGDVTATPPEPIEFSLEKDTPANTFLLRFKGQKAELGVADWPRFVEVVQGREPARWRSERVLPALADLPEAHALLRLVTTTPSYQLLLAGVDLALAIRIVEDGDEESVAQRFVRLPAGVLPSFTGSGGLFILPSDLVAPEAGSEVEELLRANKLGLARVVSDHEVIDRLYIPYAVPVGTDRFSPGTQRLWEVIRNYYYAFRYPLPVG